MSSTQSFSPGIMMNGERVEVPGWMWVWSWAIAGVDWAIQQADTPEFKERIRTFLAEQKDARLQAKQNYIEEQMAHLQKQLDEVKAERGVLKIPTKQGVGPPLGHQHHVQGPQPGSSPASRKTS